MTRILTRSDVHSLISMPDVIDAVERAHSEHAKGLAVQPTRTSVRIQESASAILPMSAIVPALGGAGLKLLSIFPDNSTRNLPALSAVVMLVDIETGRCSAIIEAGLLTAYRTAAASAVATRYLAREDATTLGLVGAGLEARTHLESMRAVRPIERVVVWSRTRETAKRFAAQCDLPVQQLSHVGDVVRVADILCTLTPAQDPIVHGSWFAPGLHVNAVGTHWLTHREIDTDAVVRSRVVVDSRDANVAECGDLMIPVEEGAIDSAHFNDELGQIINGEAPGRTDAVQITMFQSVGVAIQDIATARLLYEAAVSQEVGQEIDLLG